MFSSDLRTPSLQPRSSSVFHFPHLRRGSPHLHLAAVAEQVGAKGKERRAAQHGDLAALHWSQPSSACLCNVDLMVSTIRATAKQQSQPCFCSSLSRHPSGLLSAPNVICSSLCFLDYYIQYSTVQHMAKSPAVLNGGPKCAGAYT